ncbi:MAG TPA: hypothetical protein PKK61_12340 [Defluviitaleaceae bacterium]|nr:hypothetical protein [Defluviitaleaceae bacterium]
MDRISLDGRTKIYFDLRKKIIGRKPTRSNLKINGSDNSLYIGMNTKPAITGIIKEMFSYNSIEEFKDNTYFMYSYVSLVTVNTNINNDGQLQIKICGNGTIRSILDSYRQKITEPIFEDELILLVDFSSKKIYFEKEVLLCGNFI